MTITVWETPSCVQCKMTKRKFDTDGAVYDRRDLSAPANAETLQAFREQLGGAPDAMLQMPIVTTDTETWQGYQPDKVQKAAQKQAAQQQAVLQAPSMAGPGVG